MDREKLDLPSLLSGAEVLRALKLNPAFPEATLFRLRAKGLPAVKVSRYFKYPVDGLRDFMAGRTSAA